jgi:hypothetical protein
MFGGVTDGCNGSSVFELRARAMCDDGVIMRDDMRSVMCGCAEKERVLKARWQDGRQQWDAKTDNSKTTKISE